MVANINAIIWLRKALSYIFFRHEYSKMVLLKIDTRFGTKELCISNIIPGLTNFTMILYRITTLAFTFSMAMSLGSSYGQAKTESSKIDLKRARLTIDSLNKRGARLFFEGDSAAMYKMYAKDADLEGIKGEQILSYWGERIRYAAKNDSRKMTFTTTSLSTDGEFLVELGMYNIQDSKGVSKGKGKYLIVWKQEDGHWKLYRDIPI